MDMMVDLQAVQVTRSFEFCVQLMRLILYSLGQVSKYYMYLYAI